MRETEIERKLVNDVKAVGGKAYKFVSPGNNGVPDRIVIFPNSRPVFIELKTPSGKLSKMQHAQIVKLRSLGQEVRIIRTAKEIQNLIVDWAAGRLGGASDF